LQPYYEDDERVTHANLEEANQRKFRKNVTMLQWTQYQLWDRTNNTQSLSFSPLLHGGKLFQQWIVDSYLQVDANNLHFLRTQQKKLRAETYKGLMDYLLTTAAAENVPVGRSIILPSSFQGSPRNMRERYQDAMAIVQKFGKPDIFITFTSNPNWTEVTANLYRGQTPADRPELVARVFRMKLEALLEELIKKQGLGKVIAHVYTIEFQKRGLPHAHILLILAEEDKPRTPEMVDKLVSAELPVDHPQLLHIVTRCMIHGPCGVMNRGSVCMIEGKCSKQFPNPYCKKTVVNKDGYPLYRRRRKEPISRGGHQLDNSWVVPFNPYLTQRFNAHINIEICTSLHAVKYLFKYIYKGYDCAKISVAQSAGPQNHDEIKHFIDARYVSAIEGAWRLFESKMHDRSHSIIRLPVHLPAMQTVTFEEGHEDRVDYNDTMLTAWFSLNLTDLEARKFLYNEIPYHYVFLKGKRIWKSRKRGCEKIIPRMYTVNPKDQERFYLRILLLHVRGATGFADLRTVNGVTHASFLDAAKARHLLQDDSEWHQVLQDATATASPKLIRDLFAYILSYCQPSDRLQLWESHKMAMIEDCKLNRTEFEAEQLALMDLQEMVTF